MISIQRVLLVAGAVAALSIAAFAGGNCKCYTLGKDTCGGCADSSCDGTQCGFSRLQRGAGWDRMSAGFLTHEASGRLLVSEVLPKSPAQYAGLRAGDELISVDQMTVPLCQEEARAWQVSKKHAVVIRRQDRTILLQVEPIRINALLRRSLSPQLQSASFESRGEQLPAWAPFLSGLVVSSAGYKVVVTSVIPGSSAATNGIKPGDIVTFTGTSIGDVQLEGADYRAELTLRTAGPAGERVVNLTMTSVTEILEAASRETRDAPAVRAGL